MAIRETYMAEVGELSNDFIRMGAMAIYMMDKAFEAADTRNREYGTDVIESYERLEGLEKEIESRCLHLLLRQQPIGRELRRIIAILRMASDLERVGDSAREIAQHAMLLNNELPARLQNVKKMAAAAREMLEDSVKAYVGESMVLADYVIRRQEVVYNYFSDLKGETARYLMAHPLETDEVLDYLMISKYVERLGHHAIEVAEWVKFYRTGSYKNTQLI